MDIKDMRSRLWADAPNARDETVSEPNTSGSAARSSAWGGELGAALDIKQVAALIGCSVWAVRNSCIPKGLPCFRVGPNGKLIFYEKQVVRWVLRRQQVQGGQP